MIILLGRVSPKFPKLVILWCHIKNSLKLEKKKNTEYERVIEFKDLLACSTRYVWASPLLGAPGRGGDGADGGDGDDDRDNDDQSPLKWQLCARHCANGMTHVHGIFMPKQVGTVNVISPTVYSRVWNHKMLNDLFLKSIKL